MAKDLEFYQPYLDNRYFRIHIDDIDDINKVFKLDKS